MAFSLKQDRYRKTRGGYARFIRLYCAKCSTFLATYQKDGPGVLKRMYLDRIFEPKHLSNLQDDSLKKIPNLICSKCKEIIGTPIIYKKEKRLAVRLFEGSVVKKIIKS